MPRTVTKAQAAVYLHISPAEVIRRIERGELNGRKKTESKYSDWLVELPDDEPEVQAIKEVLVKPEDKQEEPEQEEQVEEQEEQVKEPEPEVEQPEPEPEPEIEREEVKSSAERTPDETRSKSRPKPRRAEHPEPQRDEDVKWWW